MEMGKVCCATKMMRSFTFFSRYAPWTTVDRTRRASAAAASFPFLFRTFPFESCLFRERYKIDNTSTAGVKLSKFEYHHLNTGTIKAI